MLEKFEYRPFGVCCKLMTFQIQDGKVLDVCFQGGCHGNLQGIAALVKGMSCEDVIERLQGIKCGNKMTSCPDQFSKALALAIKKED